ncbi:MAG: RsmE family RNA methyltransferase [Phycisphaerales bacterium]
MSIHRIILSGNAPHAPGTVIPIGGDEAHHAVRVKRVVAGDEVQLLDGRGMRARAKVRATTKYGKSDWQLEVEIVESRVEARSAVRLDVFAAAAKGDRLDEMLESLSQLGVDWFYPLLSDHAIVDPREAKLERLRRAALESMKQCGRAWPIEIGEPIELREAMKELAGAFACVADVTGTSAPAIPVSATRVAVFVGPEGGWSLRELEGFRASGWPFMRCAPHVLRVETASVAAATLLVNHSSLRRYTAG